MPQTIILSFTTALDYMAVGILTEMDLSSAIFCLRLQRSFLLELSADKILHAQAQYQTQPVTLGHVMKFTKYLEEAERDKRVVWMHDVNDDNAPNVISEVLERNHLQPLKLNGPPRGESGFMKKAIERANNRDGVDRVRVIV